MIGNDLHDGDTAVNWREIHEALSGIARRRGARDAEEAHWLRLAEQTRIWRHFGMVSPLDYLERKLGYAPHTAQERLRVAAALGELPATEQALADGVLAFSAVRELTRVATAATELAWVACAAGKNVREVEELVAGHQRGDHPDDPPDPELRRHRVMFELAPETFARLRQARSALADEHGRRLDDDAFIAALCEAVLESTAGGEPRTHAKYQVAKITVCESCDQAWQPSARVSLCAGPRDSSLDSPRCRWWSRSEEHLLVVFVSRGAPPRRSDPSWQRRRPAGRAAG
jgi:hypothetical protein